MTTPMDEREQRLVDKRLERLIEQDWVHDINYSERVVSVYNSTDRLMEANKSRDLRYVIRKGYKIQYAIE
jgi:hypothetical protein